MTENATREPVASRDASDHREAPVSRAPGSGAPGSGAPASEWLRVFPGEPAQVREVRHWIESVFPGCDARDSLTTIASELCANAIEHTLSGMPGGQFAVHLSWFGDRVRISVGDEGSSSSPEPVAAAGAAFVAASVDAEHGRGLFLVDALASAWGFADTDTGRVLWADQPWTASAH